MLIFSVLAVLPAGWIHCLYDVPPSHVSTAGASDMFVQHEVSRRLSCESACCLQRDFKRPIYALKHKPNKSGGDERYLPKGSWFNPEKRNWKKMQYWQPPKQDGVVPPNA